MVTESEMRIIDPEFAFYGPMGFDLGEEIDNLIMAYLASAGHGRSPGERRAFEAGWRRRSKACGAEFSRKFVELWRAQVQGDAYPATLFMGEGGAARLEGERQAYMARLFQDMVGFWGSEDHPPHPRPCPQYRFRVDRGYAPSGVLRGAKPAARPRDAGRYSVVRHHSCRHKGGAGVARLAA
jgi:hypothetical protein